MNLLGLTSGIVGIVNPFVPATIQRSAGYVTAPDGKRTPSYTTLPASAQIQALSARELQHLDGLNITGVLRKAYLAGDWRSVYRVGNQGGDRLQFAAAAPVPSTLQGTNWLIVQIFETWPDWCAVAIQLQMS